MNILVAHHVDSIHPDNMTLLILFRFRYLFNMKPQFNSQQEGLLSTF